MKKKTINVLILVLIAVFCIFIFASCNTDRPNILEYSEDDLGVMGKLVKLMHEWIENYGWTVVVFTVFLKILMLPLDFWQRYASRKSTLKMQQMQPVIEGIDKRYGANTQRANEEKQKLYKKQGFSMLSSCLPMIVSMVIFFIMFAGLRNYSTYSSITNFKEMTKVYYDAYVEQIVEGGYSDIYHEGIPEQNIDGYDTAKANADRKYGDAVFIDDMLIAELMGRNDGITAVRNHYGDDVYNELKAKALEKVQEYYEEHHESWLWIQNVWQPDTWATIMQPYEGGQFDGGGFSNTVNWGDFPNEKIIYNDIRDAVLETGGHGQNGSWNGFMILPFMSIGLSFLSMFISQRMERKNRKGEVAEQNAQQKATNRMMMIIMPLMMAWFGFIYTGAFAIYMVVNYTLSILSTIVMRYPVEKIVLKRLNKDEKKNKSSKASYMR